jgi:drug/metabolite transporter (DMT)-like permease
MDNQKKAGLHALTAVFLWSTVASAFKISLKSADQFQLLLYASAVSGTILFLIIIFQKKTALLKDSSLKDIAQSALSGFLNPFIYYIFLFRAYWLLPAQEALVLNYTWPIMLVLLAWVFLGQKIRLIDIMGIAVSFTGVLIIAGKGRFIKMDFTNFEGLVFALLSSFIWALFWIMDHKDSRDSSVKMFFNFLFGTLYIILVMPFLSEFVLLPYQAFGAAVWVGLFEMGITFLIWSRALRLSESAAKIGNLIYLTPFLSLVMINVVLKEKIMISTVAGLLFVIAGIAFQAAASRGVKKAIDKNRLAV